MQKKHIPNLLTFGRVGAIPVFVGFFYLPEPWNNGLCAFLFLFASFTDFFDGHLARKWEATSRLGQMLDPIADKLLVAVAMVLLASTGRTPMIPVLLILSREFFISGLREFMASHNVIIKVSLLAKWKTAVQMLAVFILLLGAKTLGAIALWIAAVMTVYTGWEYLRGCLPKLKG